MISLVNLLSQHAGIIVGSAFAGAVAAGGTFCVLLPVVLLCYRRHKKREMTDYALSIDAEKDLAEQNILYESPTKERDSVNPVFYSELH